MSKRCTIDTVAQSAGVSKATVSRVLNGRDVVNAATRLRVLQTMQSLGYAPKDNRPGRRTSETGHAPGRTGRIALVVVGTIAESLSHPLMARMVEDLERAAARRGWLLILERMEAGKEPGLAIRNRTVDGALLIARGPAIRHALERVARELPAVHLLATEHETANVDHVTANNTLCGELAFRLLAEHGCKSFAALNIDPSYHGALVMRLRAFMDCAWASSASPSMHIVETEGTALTRFYPEETTAYGNAADLVAALTRCPRPLGLFVPTYEQACDVYPLLRKAGLQPGQDVQVCSVGGVDSELEGLEPLPLKIDLNVPAMAARAIAQILHRIESPKDSPVRIEVAPRALPS